MKLGKIDTVFHIGKRLDVNTDMEKANVPYERFNGKKA